MSRVTSPKRALYAQLARIAKATASPARLELLDLLAQAPRTVEMLARLLGQPMANTSHHLKVLRQARLVETTRSGQFITYHLADASVADLLLQMRDIADARLTEIAAITRTYVERRGLLEPVNQGELFRRVQAGDVTVIDVRPAAEFEAGHLPGAISMPLDELEGRLKALPTDREVVAYCRGPYCVMSFDAMALLRARGFTAHRLEAGVVEWRARAGRGRAAAAPTATRRATPQPMKRSGRMAR
jgi:rhodanese-related sulfurtransferase/DNA-binding transcriptional ArsR family regulator